MNSHQHLLLKDPAWDQRPPEGIVTMDDIALKYSDDHHQKVPSDNPDRVMSFLRDRLEVVGDLGTSSEPVKD